MTFSFFIQRSLDLLPEGSDVIVIRQKISFSNKFGLEHCTVSKSVDFYFAGKL